MVTPHSHPWVCLPPAERGPGVPVPLWEWREALQHSEEASIKEKPTSPSSPSAMRPAGLGRAPQAPRLQSWAHGGSRVITPVGSFQAKGDLQRQLRQPPEWQGSAQAPGARLRVTGLP